MPKKPPRKQQGSLLWLFFGLTGVAMISATAGALLAMSLSAVPFMQSKLSAEDAALFSQENLADTNLQMPQLTRSVNILVLGTKVLDVDLPEERSVDLGYFSTINSLEGLSDVMLLLRFDPTNNKLVALSIPRDTRTLVEGYGLTKINDANYYGGPALSAKAVSNLLGGLRIDRYVRINVMGVQKLVDALGGVNLYVPSDMKYQDDSQHLYINLKQGQQHLNGEEALQFLRFRNDKLGDIGRIQRQQLMMRALVEQTLNWGTIARLPKIFSAIKEHLDTNLSLEELVALGGFATKINRSNVEMLMVPGDFSDPKQFEASYWLPNLEAIDQMMAAHFGFEHNSGGYGEIDPGSVKIAIQNSTEDWGSVDALQKILGDSGYWNSYVSDPWNQPLDKTLIVAQKGDIKSAQAIRDALGVGDVLVESTGSLLSDVTIKVGKDWIDRRSQLQNSPPPTQSP